MPRFEITTKVTYCFEVEADSREEAKEMGWDYEDYPYGADVYSIEVYEYPEEDEEEND